MPAPKRPEVKPPEYVYMRVTRFGTEHAREERDVAAWVRAGVPVYRYKVDAKIIVPPDSGQNRHFQP